MSIPVVVIGGGDVPDKDRFRYQRIDGNRLTIERRGLADAIARVAEGSRGFNWEVVYCDRVVMSSREETPLSVEKAVQFAEHVLERLWRDVLLSREMTHVDAFFVRHGLGELE